MTASTLTRDLAFLTLAIVGRTFTTVFGALVATHGHLHWSCCIAEALTHIKCACLQDTYSKNPKATSGSSAMQIGELASKAGVSVATIRYYEREGLLAPAVRSPSNYRRYAAETVKRLGFIHRCRTLQIGLAEIRRLLKLAQAADANCSEVDVLLDQHIERVRKQRRELARLERELIALRADCHPAKQVRGCGMLQEVAYR